jgi:hypothetical protein
MGYHKWLSRNRMVLTYIALPIPRHDHGVCASILKSNVGFRFQISNDVMMIEMIKNKRRDLCIPYSPVADRQKARLKGR